MLKVYCVNNSYVGLCINFQGNGYCEWRNDNIMQNENSPGCSSTIYRGKEGYLNTTLNLISDSNDELINIPIGMTKFPFMWTLMPNLPSSFDGRFGHIVYNMEAILDIPVSKCKKAYHVFFVQNLLNLNLEPTLKLPMEAEKFKDFVSLFRCKTSRLYMSVFIPYTGYTSAQTIKVFIKLANDSSISIGRTIISIRKIVSYHVKKVCKQDFETMITACVEGVESNRTKNIEYNLRIPETITNINKQNSTIIQVAYDLIVTCIPQGCHFSPRLKIPIQIGNVALVFDGNKSSHKQVTTVPEDYLEMRNTFTIIIK